LPEFAQVCAFIGTVFDTNTSGHLHKLKKMDPIDVEMAANGKPLHQLDQATFEDHIDVEPMSKLVTMRRSIRYLTDSPAKSLNGEAIKVLKALEAVIGHLRNFLVDHSFLPLFEKTNVAAATATPQE
nr:RNA-binding KH domain-containing protein PEPPER-like [Tanacetum cinerariifolium]